ncbi:hypothetical protein [Nonlabens sp.]|uniref:hypothetical protein n=1 Tax=Nonlabens sp. TaxID=1888209 RepID=UPI001BCE0E44|nr:hypothetical protein [Nonlabens sp.]
MVIYLNSINCSRFVGSKLNIWNYRNLFILRMMQRCITTEGIRTMDLFIILLERAFQIIIQTEVLRGHGGKVARQDLAGP